VVDNPAGAAEVAATLADALPGAVGVVLALEAD
jgi:hypothetical protein